MPTLCTYLPTNQPDAKTFPKFLLSLATQKADTTTVRDSNEQHKRDKNCRLFIQANISYETVDHR